MKNKNVLITVTMWFATSAAVITGIIVTKDPYCLLGLGVPAFITIMLNQ